MPMTLVSTVTAGAGGLAQFEFAGIPQTGKDLFILTNLRTNAAQGGTILRFNGVSSGHVNRLLQGTGTSVSSYDNITTAAFLGDTSNSNDTTNAFGSGATYIPNYSGSTTKTFSTDSYSENSGAAANQFIIAHSWSNTSAITSLVILPQSASAFVQHSTVSLYIVS